MSLRTSVASLVLALALLVPSAVSAFEAAASDRRALPCLGPVVLAGCEAWVVRTDGGASGYFERGIAVEVAPDGSTVYALGRTNPSEWSYQGTLLALDPATGAEAWRTDFVAYQPVGLRVAPDGARLYVVSTTQVLAFSSADGALAWAVPVGLTPQGLVVSPDGGRVYVSGEAWAGNVARGDLRVRALDAATGALLWSASRGRTPTSDEGVLAYGYLGVDRLAVSSDGLRLFATIDTAAPSGDYATWDFWTVALDAADGSRVWDRTWAGPAGGRDLPTQVATAGDAVVVAGWTRVSPERYDSTGYAWDAWNDLSVTHLVVLAYDAATGAPRWERTHAEPPGYYGYNLVKAAALAARDGRVYVTGWTGTCQHCSGWGDSDYLTLALDGATGATLWSRRYDGPWGGDIGRGLVLAPDGLTLYVTGLSAGLTIVADLVTVAYEAATGEPRWVARHPGSDVPLSYGDGANAVAVAPDGSRVFATGAALKLGDLSSKDMVTVAYAATGFL